MESNWIKYTGDNPPTNTSKDVRWRVTGRHHIHSLAGESKEEHHVPETAVAYQYLEPYKEPEMPDEIFADIDGHWLKTGCTEKSPCLKYIRKACGSMAETIVTIALVDEERLEIKWADDDSPFLERLGYLEWAKAVCIEAKKIENAKLQLDITGDRG